MRKYLSTLHKRSDAHKRRFAFATSASITLLIFAFWGMATFDTVETMVKKENKNEPGPFESLVANTSRSLGQFGEGFRNLRDNLKEFYNGGL